MEERKVYVNGDDDNILKETVMAHLLEAILLTKKICPVEDAKIWDLIEILLKHKEIKDLVDNYNNFIEQYCKTSNKNYIRLAIKEKKSFIKLLTTKYLYELTRF